MDFRWKDKRSAVRRIFVLCCCIDGYQGEEGIKRAIHDTLTRLNDRDEFYYCFNPSSIDGDEYHNLFKTIDTMLVIRAGA